jgi:hypothetical protein
MFMFVSVCVCVYLCLYEYVCVYVYCVPMCVCMLCVCVCVCVCVCMYMYLSTMLQLVLALRWADSAWSESCYMSKSDVLRLLGNALPFVIQTAIIFPVIAFLTIMLEHMFIVSVG